MEKIYYDELWNNKVISSTYAPAIVSMSILVFMLFFTAIASIISGGIYIMFLIFDLICIPLGVFVMIKRYKETTEIKKTVTYYNDCIKNNNFLEVDDDLKSGFIDISKDIILNKLELVWEPEFVYDDEIKVYKAESTETIIVYGYFKDISVSRTPKRKFIMVFNDCEYYMCCIDNLICWEKGTYWSKFYKGKALKNAKIDYTKW